MNLDKMSAVLTFVLAFIGFITGIVGIFGAIVICIASPLIINGLYVLFKGKNTWLVLKCGVDPQKLGYEYKGNGRWEHPQTGEWVQFENVGQ